MNVKWALIILERLNLSINVFPLADWHENCRRVLFTNDAVESVTLVFRNLNPADDVNTLPPDCSCAGIACILSPA